MDLFLLRRHFGLSANDVMNRLPAWEVDLLASCVRQELEAQAQANGDPTEV